jgi:2-methylisocitrate lyase-like PEP mutase family enzyme
MDDQRSRADEFRRLHVAGDPLVLFNAWDAGSAARSPPVERARSPPGAGR